MKAMILQQFGTADEFKLGVAPQATVSPGHVIIKVIASSINPIDIKIRSGAVPSVAPEFPAILNADVAGVITAVSSDVTKFKIGDEVYGCGGGVKGTRGALAEYMLVDTQLLAFKPKTLSLIEAAGFPLVGITAWEALFTKSQIRAKQHILIHGGLGGVGHLAVQMAKAAGCIVSTTVSDDKFFAEAKQFGADNVINFNKETVADYVDRLTKGEGYEMIFDTVGGGNIKNSFAAAAYDGVIATTVARITEDLTPMHDKGLSLHTIFMLVPLLINKNRKLYGEILSKMAELIDQKKLRLKADPQQFKFSEIAKAHAYVEAGKASGKVILVNDLSEL